MEETTGEVQNFLNFLSALVVHCQLSSFNQVELVAGSIFF